MVFTSFMKNHTQNNTKHRFLTSLHKIYNDKKTTLNANARTTTTKCYNTQASNDVYIHCIYI